MTLQQLQRESKRIQGRAYLKAQAIVLTRLTFGVNGRDGWKAEIGHSVGIGWTLRDAIWNARLVARSNGGQS